ncbi:hypothetical protein LCGC14_0441780 [marine sediment metagenome]|uniref:Uncharacterized protein n=1 Tax=marine sediment metagenome TaxID=412755 RepID=A0A0F9SR31_9ZZZZ
MKTKITFELISPTKVKVLHDGNEAGLIWSENDNGLPYPHNENDSTKESIQVCGFTEASKIWACGIFHGTKDVVLRFNPMEGPFYEKYKRGYKSYVETCLKTNNHKSIKTFDDFCSHMGYPDETMMEKYIAEHNL